jgi:glutathione peroxidase-family protein
VGLEQLHETYRDRGFSVVGFPCNQFGGQEPGTAGEIQEFCSATYGVSFPLMQKIEVNGPGRHPVYEELTAVPDADGEAGDIQWNFEKFLVGPDGAVIARFRRAPTPGTRRWSPLSRRTCLADGLLSATKTVPGDPVHADMPHPGVLERDTERRAS